MTDKEKRILDVLKRSNNALSAKEIAVMMYGPDSAQQLVYSKLLKLEALGLVEKYYAKRSYKFIFAGDNRVVKLDDTTVGDIEDISKDEVVKSVSLERMNTQKASAKEESVILSVPVRTRKKEYDVYGFHCGLRPRPCGDHRNRYEYRDG